MNPLERSREFSKQAMEPWKEEPTLFRKIRLLIPLQLPSMNKIQGNSFASHDRRINYGLKAKEVKMWRDHVELAVRTQPATAQVKYFRDRLGMTGIYYNITITARLLRLYDDDNCFIKYLIDALKGSLITDDSLKFMTMPVVLQELIPSKRFGNKKAGTLRYIGADGKQVYPETIIEIELIEREGVLL